GADIVVLDEAVVPLGLTAEERGRSLNWIAEGGTTPAGRVGPIVFSGGTRAQTPLSPVHLAGRRGVDGIRLSWLRRSRIDGEDVEGVDMPHDEPKGRYRREILNGAAVMRAADVGERRFLYGAEDEIADFGAVQTQLSIRVRQMGRAVPLGLAGHAQISLLISEVE